MRAIVTGQVGMEKTEYLDVVAKRAGQRGENVAVYHVGKLMYAEAPDVRPGRILDLSLSRLHALRRSVIKDVISDSSQHKHMLVNTHATFRWRHGLFAAFDFDQIQALRAEMFICLVDNIEVVHHRLHQEHEIDATLKDCMVWREEEILATELMAQAAGCRDRFYILARGRHQDTVDSCIRLITRPDMRKVYPSFPMSHVVDMPDVLAEIDHFRQELAKHFISFDPGDVDEKLLLDRAIAASRNGEDFLDVEPHSFGGRKVSESPIRVPVRQVLDIAGDVDGQIYMRDFRLIDQADMICSYIPELPGGIPGLSSGVERELQHAWEHTKEVYVVWKPAKQPSPFITETATRIFKSVDEALKYFEDKGMFAARDLFGN